MSILEVHKAYSENLPLWRKVDIVCEGQDAVKAAGKLFLPMPESFQSEERYKEYLSTAVFYGVTGTTLSNYVGTAFNKLPSFKRPIDLDYLLNNADGAGRSIYQASQKMLRLILKNYRCGVYVDYPTVPASRNKAEEKQKNHKAVIHVIDAKAILDWDFQLDGNQSRLSYVKIKEVVSERDGFVKKEIEQYRVLRLEDGIYTVQIYRLADDKKNAMDYGKVTPTDYNGKTWEYIPFTFCGAIDNSDDIHKAPLLEQAELNLAHYKNSADVEESGFLVGQPIITMPNLDLVVYDEMKKDQAKGESLQVGASIMFPTKVEMVQALPNTLSRELMEDKWQKMKEIGARLGEAGSANKTATQADNDASVQHSVISLCVSNVSEALTMALQHVARFELPKYELDFDELSYVISQDFNKPKFSEERAKRLYDACVANNLPWEVWYTYEQSGMFSEDDWQAIETKLDIQRSSSPNGNYIPE